MNKIISVYLDVETGEKLNLEMKFVCEQPFYRFVGQVTPNETGWYNEAGLKMFLGSGIVEEIDDSNWNVYDSVVGMEECLKGYAKSMKEKGVCDLFIFPCFCTSLARGEIVSGLSVQETMGLAVKYLIKELGVENGSV